MVYRMYSVLRFEPNGRVGGIVGIPTFPGHDRGHEGGGDRGSGCARMYENQPRLTRGVFWNGRERGENRHAC